MTITFLDELSGYIWINGELIKWQDAKIHILTHSLHYAGAAFEGERAYNGKVFKLEEHTKRLIASAESLRMKLPYSFDEIIEAHELVIKKNDIQDAYVRPLVFRGSESLNITNKSLSVSLMVAAIPSMRMFSDNLNIHVSNWRKPHPNSCPPQVKSSGHYNMTIVAQEEAKAAGYDDAILLDWRGYIAECTTTNIFFAIGNTLVTPIADAFLDGITRRVVIELAKELGFEVKEQYVELESIRQYDECFITGSALEIKRVGSVTITDVDGELVKVNFQDNRISKALQSAYYDLVRR